MSAPDDEEDLGPPGRTRALTMANRRPTIAAIGAAPFPVSSRSFWAQSVWHLDYEARDGFMKVDFGRLPRWLHDTAKMMLWLALSGAVTRARQVGTVAGTANLDYVFTRISKFVDSLEELRPAHFEAFVDLLRVDLAREYPKGPSKGIVWPILAIWRQLWEQRDALAAAGLQGLSFDPFEARAARNVVASFKCRISDPVPPLPEAVTALILPEAEAMVERADCVIGLQARVLRSIAELGGAQAEVVGIVRDWPFRDADGSVWHVVPPGVATVARAIEHLHDLTRELSGAATFLAFHETGQRISEFMSIPAGRNEDIGLPSCIERLDFEGEGLSVYLLHATAFKWKQRPEPGVWVIGGTGLRSNALPPAVRAIDALERLNAPWRGASGRLQVAFRNHAHEARRSGGRPVAAGTICQNMRLFLANRVPWRLLSGDGASAAIARDAGAAIVPMNMRKGLVNYGVRLDQTLLGPLSRQLQHDDDLAVDVSYAGNDPELLEPAGEFASLEVARVMLAASGATSATAGTLPASLSSHLADVDAVRVGVAESLVLETAAQAVGEQGLAPARRTLGTTEAPRQGESVDLLLQRYRANRRVHLEAVRTGLGGTHDAFERQAEALKARLKKQGVDVPGDWQLTGGRE